MLRVVFDTVVFVRSLINPHSCAGRLAFEHADKYELFLSRLLLEEIFEVLNRPELTTKYRTRDVDYPRVFSILGRASVVEVDEIPAVVRDPKDDKVVATAVAAHVECIVNVATFLDLLLRSD